MVFLSHFMLSYWRGMSYIAMQDNEYCSEVDMSYLKGNLCRLILLLLLLLLWRHTYRWTTTKWHMNNNKKDQSSYCCSCSCVICCCSCVIVEVHLQMNNKITYEQQQQSGYELLKIEQEIFIDWSSCSCCYCVILLL